MIVTDQLQSWLDSEFAALVDFARRSRTQYGFSTLDAAGNADEAAGLQLWINCRMTHVFCLATLRGDESARDFATHGIAALRENFYDAVYGGFFTNLDYATGAPVTEVGARKAAYAHAFVLLASSSGMQAGILGARELYELALDAHESYFWECEFGLVCESFDRGFTQSEDYRGANANMHTLEASLAAWDATADPRWLEKAGSILAFVLGEAEKIGWRIPEHFDANWHLLPDFNKDRPADPFRPFGLTPGHGIEWARLAMHYWAAKARLGGLSDASNGTDADDAPAGATNDAEVPAAPADVAREDSDLDRLPSQARALFLQAIADGWFADGEPGIVYTTDFAGTPVVHERMHWTVCEALSASAAFATYGQEVGEADVVADMERWFDTFLAFAKEHLIEAPGRWIHELDRTNSPSGITWPGKPDVYHAAQCVLMPNLPLTPTFAGALKLT
ncbi:AGE family epimerase/isomerase [Trueperella pecoris]|uniref:AGE family epimerase/isomerase n=1 Tax=Trueperella pecoris TaxID=2733571 RepID=A0A7M1QWB1_9ACTO|nr:AGE family epimerase/isomerase [Trueperella pecoris]QOR45437.1 AGE family epimerase/isomerase [Trueperella pecoris]QTG75321.1 AGE family epimerase/isomerase [Trueperella pecoris]